MDYSSINRDSDCRGSNFIFQRFCEQCSERGINPPSIHRIFLNNFDDERFDVEFARSLNQEVLRQPSRRL
jgi:hypothetical protein